MVILELIHAPIPDSDEGMSLVVTEPTQALPGLVVFHNNQTNRTASVGDVSSFKFQTYPNNRVWAPRCLAMMPRSGDTDEIPMRYQWDTDKIFRYVIPI